MIVVVIVMLKLPFTTTGTTPTLTAPFCASAAFPMGHWRHYVFDLSVRLSVRRFMQLEPFCDWLAIDFYTVVFLYVRS